MLSLVRLAAHPRGAPGSRLLRIPASHPAGPVVIPLDLRKEMEAFDSIKNLLGIQEFYVRPEGSRPAG
jgi:hypothetical protein